MRKVLGTLALSLLLLSCQNKSKQEYSPTLTETQSEESYQLPDTAVTEEVKERQEEVKVQSTPTSFHRLALMNRAVMSICVASTQRQRMTWRIMA
jgi:hypothetical protein